MRKYFILATASLLSACSAGFDWNCGPFFADGQAWASAQKKATPDAYRQYLLDFPEGCFVPEASRKLKTTVEPKQVKKVVGSAVVLGATY
jgi:hypothetical protein